MGKAGAGTERQAEQQEVGVEGRPPADCARVGGVDEVGPVGRHQGNVEAGDDQQRQLPRLSCSERDFTI